ncbi:MAG: UvrD-helicase domain-containing protein [Bacteroidales bacterium]|nr:UvrD-helicase domain-containing protein [Bacteroidales bacterium]
MKNFVVYKSSAGSGKTTILAIEYLKLSLVKPENFKHILALTFTKDAANEMKQRILEYLIQIVNYTEGNELDFIFNPIIASQDKYINLGNKEGRQKSIEEIQKQARLLLQLILHNYSDFAISTIDSFTHRVIKSFAHDLGIAISFDVELDADNLLKMAVNDLISRIGNDNPRLTEVLLDFSLHKIGSDKSRKIDDDLRGLAKNLLEDVKEEFLIDLRKLSIEDLLKVKDEVFAELKVFKNFVNDIAQKAKKLIHNQGLDCNSFYHGNGNICNWFIKLSHPNFAVNEIKPKAWVWKSINENVWCAGKADGADQAKIESIKEELVLYFHKLNDFIEENLNNYLIFKQVSQQIYPLVVLNEIEKLIFQLKAESNVLHISDFNKLIAQAISGEPAPFIYERIGNWYWHFLLDEFQDTSSLQWNNLLPLIENSLSENHFNLVVGDGKQSIYRWRGSEVKQFVELPELLNKPDDLSYQRERLLKENYQEEPLQVNYRSDEEIVKFNNDLFQFIQASNWLPDSAKKVYDQVKQSVASDKLGAGMIDIHLTEEKNENILNSKILDSLNLALKEKYEYRDITILVRKNSEATAYADILIEHNIPVISSVALRVSSSSKVKFLLSFFQSILHPKEILYKTEIIRFLLKEQLLGEHSLANFHQLVSGLMLGEKDFSMAFSDLLEKYGFRIDQNKLNQADVYELAEYLVRVFKLQTPDPYLQFFLDFLHEFKRVPYSQLSDFMIWWTDHEHENFIDLPSGLNAVTIQTIFKAKGLQYPVVIFPITDKSLKTMAGRNKSWLNPGVEKLNKLKSFPFSLNSLKDTTLSDAYDEEQANQKLDDTNLIYVALTRAKHRLFILANKFEEKKSKKATENIYNSFTPSAMFNEYLADKKEFLLEEGCYRFGNTIRLPDAKHIEDSSFYYLKKMNGASWRSHLSLSNSSEFKPLAEKYTQLIWGIYVHEIMASIRSINDVQKGLDRALYAGYIKPQDQLRISDYIDQIVNHSILSAFYLEGLHVANETDLIDSFGQFHRPDRLVFLKEKTVVIDYKTGKPNEKHKQQVRAYAELLAQMNFPKPESYLVYLKKTVEVVKV